MMKSLKNQIIVINLAIAATVTMIALIAVFLVGHLWTKPHRQMFYRLKENQRINVGDKNFWNFYDMKIETYQDTKQKFRVHYFYRGEDDEIFDIVFVPKNTEYYINGNEAKQAFVKETAFGKEKTTLFSFLKYFEKDSLSIAREEGLSIDYKFDGRDDGLDRVYLNTKSAYISLDKDRCDPQIIKAFDEYRLTGEKPECTIYTTSGPVLDNKTASWFEVSEGPNTYDIYFESDYVLVNEVLCIEVCGVRYA